MTLAQRSKGESHQKTSEWLKEDVRPVLLYWANVHRIKETGLARTTVVWRQGMHFCTSTQAGQLMCDESSEIGAAYPSSPELLMASLGSCIGSVLVYFAERHKIDLEGMSIELDWKIKEKPRRIGEIDVAVHVPHHLSKDQETVLRRVAEECLIHNTLHMPPQINMNLSGTKEPARGS